jgi:hypothetical protein
MVQHDVKLLNLFLGGVLMADEETNKLVDDVEDKEPKQEEPKAEPELPVEPEPVSEEIANPPVEDVGEAASIEEVMALVKQLQAQVDALSTIQPEPEPEPQQPEQAPQEEAPAQEDPEDIEKLLDL